MQHSIHWTSFIASSVLSLSLVSALQVPSFQALINSGLSSSVSITRLKQVDFPSACGTVKGICSEISYRPNDMIMDIPVSSAITTSENDDSVVQLAIQLIEEFHLEDESKFASYIALLPPPGMIQTPFHWHEKEIESLTYPYVIKSIQLQKQKWKELFDALPKDRLNRSVDFSRFIWGMENVASRAFTGILGVDALNLRALSIASIASLILGAVSFQITNNEVFPITLGILAICLSLVPQFITPKTSSTVLLPIIDSCNHQGSSPMATLALEPSSGRFTVRANCDISAGSQITISYGKRSNDDLLQYFGFVEEDNVHDRYVIPAPLTRLKDILLRESLSSQASSTLLAHISERLNTPNFIDSSLIITRGPSDGWIMGSLDCLNEPAFRNSAEIEAERDTRLTYALRTLIENEIDSFQKQVDLDAIDPRRRRIIETFRREKLRLLQFAIKSL